MRSTTQDLRSVLADEAEGYRKLVDLAQREQLALKNENIADLAATIKEKEYLLLDLQKLESAREQIVSQQAQELNLPGNVTLSDLIKQFDDATAQQLSKMQKEFAGLVKQLFKLNYSNRTMLQAGLVRVDATFDYLTSLAVPEGYYTANGTNQVHPNMVAGHVFNWEV